MTSVDTETMEAVHNLLKERHRFEGWIEALQQKKGTTPPHVFQRVLDDYTGRLQKVLDELSTHTEQVRSALEQMTARLAELKQTESDRKDARYEGELRSAVGEYSEEEWSELKTIADSEIEEVGVEIKAIEGEISELQKLVDSSKPSPKANSTTRAAVAAVTAAMESKRPEIDDYFSESSETPVVEAVAPRTGNQEGSTDNVQHVSDTAPSLFSSNSSGSNATTAQIDSRRESEKTLQCPECSAMNYATEWYCERCGGELATY